MHITDPEFDFTSSPRLYQNEVHLWRIDLQTAAQDGRRWESLLSPDEQDRAQRFRFPNDRLSYTAVRGSLRSILATYLECDARKLSFCYSGTGKPSLGAGSSSCGIQFNVSHSGRAALLAFTRQREIGVDVEKIRQDIEVDTIARRFFSVREQEQLAAIESSLRYEAFFRCWTRKEAYLKAKGAGLSLPLGQFDVSIQPWHPDCLMETRPDGSEARQWSLTEVPAGHAYAAALCVRGRDWVLRSWQTAA